MESVTIYTRPGCGKCEQTKKLLDAASVPYNTKDIEVDDVARQEVVQRFGSGPVSLPVVRVDHGTQFEWWEDFRIDKIKGVIAAHKAREL